MKRFLIALMCVAVVFCYVPTMAFADQDVPAVQEQSETFADSEETEQNTAPTPQAGTEEVRGGLSLTAPAAAQHIYVSGSGSDESGDGSEANPYATLAKAAEVVNQDTDPGNAFTIHVMSDLTAKACARFYDHAVTIVGEGETSPTVSRGEGFAMQQDTARGTYNPAMIEIQTANAPASLTLRNIILDDDGLHEGSVFAQAVSQGENEGGTPNNSTYVQDAIIASNATKACTITLGAGTVLRNYGGMSAVRVTNQAVLKMEAGSAMEDTTVTDRTKGSAEGEVGPAGAVWTQGGTLLMKAGAEIRSMVGRAIYADGGSITIGGKIYNIKGDVDMWQGTNGVALHLRNDAVGSIQQNAVISDLDKGESAIAVLACNLNVGKNTVIKNLKNMIGIADSYDGIVYFDGEITGMQGSKNALNIQNDNFNVTIGPNAWIHDNHTGYGTIYSQGTGGTLHIYGKINNNIASDRGGGLAMANNFGPSTVTMYDGAEICNNYSAQTGGGVMVSVGTFIMKGGKISNNVAKNEGGGIYVRRGGTLILEAGTVVDNQTRLFGGGIAYEASDYKGCVPCVELDGGSVSGNKMHVTISKNNDAIETTGGASNDIAISEKSDDVFSHITRYLNISDKINLSDKNIYFVKDNKTLTPAPDRLNLKLGNASAKSNAVLTAVSDSHDWTNPHATYWMQLDGAARKTVGGLSLIEGAPQIVYAIAIPVDENGNPETLAEIQGDAFQAARARIHHTKITESGIEVTIPEGHPNGYAVALVQPTQDFGSLMITTSKAQLDYDKDKTADGTYEVPYTASYTMSDSLWSLFDAARTLDNPKLTFTLTLELDKRLTGKEASNCKFTSPIFEAEAFTISRDGHAVTVTCKLKADWRNHLEELVKTPMVFTGTGVLNGADFAAGEFLSTSGNVQMTIPRGGSEMYPIYIPGNVCQTKMVKEEAPIGPIGPVTTYYTIKAAAGEGGSIAPNGYVTVSAGSDKRFAIAAAEGYEIKDVLVDGVSVGAVSDYTFKNVWKNHTIDAVFRAKAEDPETPDEPAKPENPRKPETPDKPTKLEDKTKVPKTGDDAVLAGSALLLLLSACGLAAVLRKREEK
ncbi:MAG: hypothetical protein ACLUJC_12445 [Clostridia bacterium]